MLMPNWLRRRSLRGGGGFFGSVNSKSRRSKAAGNRCPSQLPTALS
ncbi:hypothetical protein LEMLEM_LOCUS10761 [Lemmus lemmus]